MKFLIFLAFIGLCNCEIALPEVISEAKDALEAAGNVKFLEYLKEIYGSDVVKKIEGEERENESFFSSNESISMIK